MAEPKKRSSKRRQGFRRKTHSTKPVELKVCKSCGKKTIPHAICKNCGTYNK